LPATFYLFLEAVAELYVRNNLTVPLSPRAGAKAVYHHIFKTGIFRVAEMDAKLVSSATRLCVIYIERNRMTISPTSIKV